MSAVVGPDIPIVVGLSLGVLAVLVVQKSDDLVQHWLGNGNARAKHRSRKLQGKVGADALLRNEILDACSSADAGRGVKLHSLVNALADRVMHCGLEMGLRQR